MQKSNTYLSVIRQTGLLGLIDIGLVVVLFVSNALLVFAHSEVLSALENILQNFHTNNVIVLGSVLTSIFGLVINYNVLKVMLQLAIGDFNWQEILFVYSMSSVLATVMSYTVMSVLTITYDIYFYSILVNSMYSVFVFVIINIFVWQKLESEKRDVKTIIKLNCFIAIYIIINLVIGLLGVSAYG